MRESGVRPGFRWLVRRGERGATSAVRQRAAPCSAESHVTVGETDQGETAGCKPGDVPMWC